MACSVAASAYIETSPIVRVVLRVQCAGLSNAVRHPNRVLRPVYSPSSGSACTQFSNVLRRANAASTVFPSGLTAPIPVTTTLLLLMPFFFPVCP